MTEPAAAAGLDALLAPIPGEGPSGESLRYDGIYQHIVEARREEDPALPQGDWERPLKRADWARVVELCADALAARSKDLQIAAWLAEGWLHLDGLEGLARGLGLIDALCERYWDALHPRVEDGDIEYRVAPFVWMNEHLALALRRSIRIVADPSQPAGSKLTLADWTEAVRMERLALKDAHAATLAQQAGKPTRAALAAGAAHTPGAFFRDLIGGISRCEAALAALDKTMSDKLRDESPGLSQVRGALQEMRAAVRDLGGEQAIAPGAIDDQAGKRATADGRPSEARTSEGADMSADDATSANTPAAPGGEPIPSGCGPITSREEAYRRLAEAADFLMRTEPHSPCPYLVKRAVAWGRMPLTDLLQELMRTEGGLQGLFELIGMRPGPPKS